MLLCPAATVERDEVTSRYTGRLAPSPTGYLHLGHAATFLTAFDRARAAQGRLLLRIDDLDPQRSRQVYTEAVREDLRWLGLRWDGELLQSDRLPQYRRAMEQLVESGQVYPCTCSRKELQQAIQAPHEGAEDEPMYSGRCRPPLHASATSVPRTLAAQTNYRFRVPYGEAIRFPDLQCGPQRFRAGIDFGDFLVWRKDGLPSYQLATVVDDAEFGITEVVRGRDLLRSTARQILLQRAMHYATPQYFHTELLQDEEGRRLAKRHDALSLRALRSDGVTPAEIRARVEALLHHSKT